MGRHNSGGAVAAPPPPKEAGRLVQKAIADAQVWKTPPKGWLDEELVMEMLAVSMTVIAFYIREGFFEASGYSNGAVNKRCIKEDAVSLFMLLFPKGSHPIGEHSRMRMLAAIQYGKDCIARGKSFTADDAVAYAEETLAIAQWVYGMGVNRRPKNKPDADTGIYRWPSQADRELYGREQNEKRRKEAADAEEARIAEETELTNKRIEASVDAVVRIRKTNPQMTAEQVEGMINTSDVDIRSVVRERVTAALAELLRPRTDAEIDAMLFTAVNPIGDRSEFVLYAMRSCARRAFMTDEPINPVLAETYAAAQLQASSWMHKYEVRVYNREDLVLATTGPNTPPEERTFAVYPTKPDYVAFIAWRHVKRELQQNSAMTREEISKVLDGINAERISKSREALSPAIYDMVFAALTKEGWKEVEEPLPPIPPSEYFIELDLVVERFGVDKDFLNQLASIGGIRMAPVGTPGGGMTGAYSELDLAILRHLTPYLGPEETAEEIAGKIEELRPVATYDGEVFRLNGEVPMAANHTAVKGEVDVYLSIVEVSQRLKLHVGTVGALANLGIARTSGERVSLRDVTIFAHSGAFSSVSFDYLKAHAAKYKSGIEGQHSNYVYRPARMGYERIENVNTKQPPKKSTTKKAKAETTPAKAKKAVKTAKAEPVAKAKPKKAVKVRKETPREENNEASAAAESLTEGVPMLSFEHAYNLHNVAQSRVKALVTAGVLRGDLGTKMVSQEDIKIFTDMGAPPTTTEAAIAEVKVKVMAKRKGDGKSKPKVVAKPAAKTSTVVDKIIDEGKKIIERKGDDDAELVLVTPKLDTIEKVVAFFTGSVVEKYGADPEDWPDVVRSLGLGLGVIKKG